MKYDVKTKDGGFEVDEVTSVTVDEIGVYFMKFGVTLAFVPLSELSYFKKYEPEKFVNRTYDGNGNAFVSAEGPIQGYGPVVLGDDK
ncbi:hypothetical protein BpJC4_31030 [Weizmannia acidilactici]|uniref:hypothetical protein n=1 Tax=Weizmannia acidilactici TaxID=2607726 RepID=UPI00124F6F00|nr:hypothetical protein [Weizmannia acidilactici]GER68632.1 hypothetical protein BpJC4_31030 [Weizmannia acidilactici]